MTDTERLADIAARCEAGEKTFSDIPFLLAQIIARDAEIAALRMEKTGTDAGYEFAVESKAAVIEQRDKLRYNLSWAFAGLDKGSALGRKIAAVLKEIP